MTLQVLMVRFRLGPGPSFEGPLGWVGLVRTALRLPEGARVLALRARAPSPPRIRPGDAGALEVVFASDPEPMLAAVASALEAAVGAAPAELEVTLDTPELTLPRWDGPVVLETLTPIRFPRGWGGAAPAARFWFLSRARLLEAGRSHEAEALALAADATLQASFRSVSGGSRETAGAKHTGRVLLRELPTPAETALRLLELVGVGPGTLVGLGHVALRPGARTLQATS